MRFMQWWGRKEARTWRYLWKGFVPSRLHRFSGLLYRPRNARWKRRGGFLQDLKRMKRVTGFLGPFMWSLPIPHVISICVFAFRISRLHRNLALEMGLPPDRVFSDLPFIRRFFS